MRINLGEFRNQVSVINNNLNSRNRLFINMIKDINDIVIDDRLAGEGYQRVKEFFRAAYVGVAYGMLITNDLIISANNEVINTLSYIGVETIDTDDLSRILSRINAFTAEMNAIHEVIEKGLFGIERTVTVKGPDRSGEIARERMAMDNINRMVEADERASSYYMNAESKLQDVVLAIDKIKTIMYNYTNNNFDFYIKDYEPFAHLYMPGSVVKVPSDILINLSDSDKLKLNDMIGINFSALVQLGAIKLSNEENVVEDINKGIQNFTINELPFVGVLGLNDDITKKYYHNTFYRPDWAPKDVFQCTTFAYGRALQLTGIENGKLPVNMRGTFTDENGNIIPQNTTSGGNAGQWILNMQENKDLGEPYYKWDVPTDKGINVSNVKTGDFIVWGGKYGHVAIVENIIYENNIPVKVTYSEGNWGYNPSNPVGYYERTIDVNSEGYLIDGAIYDINSSNPGFNTRANGEPNGLTFVGVIHTDAVYKD